MEQNKILLEYTTLNNDFKQRLKDENRYQDEKEVEDKRPILESPSPSTRKTWFLEEINNDLEKRKPYKKDIEAMGFTSSPSLGADKDKDSEEGKKKDKEELAKKKKKKNKKKRG